MTTKVWNSDHGYDSTLKAFDLSMKKLGLEYRMITQYLLREIETREEMTTLLANAIKQFAKRQMTWFRRDQSIRWLDMAREPVEEACGLIDAFLSE